MIKKAVLISCFVFILQCLSHAEEYFGVTPHLDELNDRQKQCLCSAACYKENWNCNVVNCYFDPTNSCNEYFQGECYCGGFGCGRAKISSLSGSDMLDCIVSPVEPDSEIEKYDTKIRQLLNGILIYASKGNEIEVQTASRQLSNEVNNKISYLVDIRDDIDEKTKNTIKTTINDLVNNVRFQEIGKGSKIDSCGFLWVNTCLYLDPITSQDIIAHEFAHVIVEKLTQGYELPAGNSTHDFAGYSSSIERAYDEALATVVAADLLGRSKYSSIESEIDVNYNSVKLGEIAENEYTYDFVRQVMIEYPNSNSEDPIIFDDKNVNWYGYSGSNKQKALDKLSKIELDLELYKKNKEISKVQELILQKHKLLRYLNPPAYSPKSEVAVSSLIWDLSGSNANSYRLGRIKKAIDDYYNKFGYPPKNELEFLKGFLMNKDLQDKDFNDAYSIITGLRHQRKYQLDDLR